MREGGWEYRYPICRQKLRDVVSNENSPNGQYTQYGSFGELSLVPQIAAFHGKLVHCLLDSNRNSHRSTHHGVVTHAEEAHHLHVCGNLDKRLQLIW